MSDALILCPIPPYDWAAMHAFLAGRAIPGIEAAPPGRYLRSVVLDGRPGWLAVEPDSILACTALRITLPFPNASPAAMPRLRRLFDVDADPRAIGAHLSRDPRLAPLVAARPGLRVPGAWDGFEMAVRAILGQQVSVTAATRLAGRLVGAFGTPLPPELAGAEGITHLFPTPERLAEADIASALGMPGARARAIRTLAQALVAEPGLLDPGRGLAEAVARLKGLRGVGEWTAQYIAMRALREPDAMPHGDIGLLRALDSGAGRPTPRELLARSVAWSPWRAYATLHLWAHDAERQSGIAEQGTG